ncbi:MAG: fibronectin type III domain-containing protein [Kiritimatiellales bacterium]|nr:fibronectin type III domain-containing protein [Kiritimatiellales bacterium]
MNKEHKTKVGICIAAILLLATIGADATVLVEWDIENVSGVSADTISLADGMSASSIDTVGVVPLSRDYANSYPGSFAATEWSLASNKDYGKYYTFTVTPDAGNTLSVTGIGLALTRGNYQGLGAEEWELRSSLDGFASNLLTFDLSNTEINEQKLFEETFGSALTTTGSIEFRLSGAYPGASSDYSGLANMLPDNYDGDIMIGIGSNVRLIGNISEPAAPSDLAATPSSTAGQIDLSWTDNSNNENGFIIEQSTTAIGGPYSQIHDSAAANVVAFSVTGLDSASTYWFRIKAYNAAGSSDYATTSTAGVSPTSSGVDVRAYQTAEGVVVEFVAYDVEEDGTIQLALIGASGKAVWSGTVNATDGPRFFARFQVPGLELGGTYNFLVRDEVGKWWEANGVTVGSFNTEMTSASLAGITLTFDSLPEREYNIQWLEQLGGSWQTVDTVTASERDTTTVVVPYPAGNDAVGFFRIQQR